MVRSVAVKSLAGSPGIAVLGALDLADFVTLWHGHADAGEGERVRSRTVEDDALLGCLLAGRGDEDLVLGGDAGRRWRGRIGCQQLMLAFADAAGNGQREQYEDNQP